MREIFPGVFHWTALHDGIGADVSSHYLQPAGIVIDPMAPAEGLEWFEDNGRPQQVVLTSGNHARQADRCAERWGIPIVPSREGAEGMGDALAVESYGDGDEVAADVQAVKL